MVVIEEVKTEEVKEKKTPNSKADAEMPTMVEEQEDEEEEEKDDEKEDLKENAKQNEDDDGGAGGKFKQNRNEKKARNALKNLGLIPVSDVLCVRMRRDKKISFVINKPDVRKCPNSDTYVIFGEAKIEDATAQLRSEAAERFTQKPKTVLPPTSAKALGEAKTAGGGGVGTGGDQKAEAYIEEEEEEAGDEDAGGIDEKDIQLVMSQASCTRRKAIAALKKNNNDLVEAIMQLSS